MNIKIKIGILLFLTFLVCIAIGIYIYKIEQVTNQQMKSEVRTAKTEISDECTREAEELAMVNGIEKKVSPNAVFIMKTQYTKCGHTIKKVETAPLFAVNLTQKELEIVYENWSIENFSNNEVVMKKVVEGICDEHFVLRADEGEITIYQIDENGNENLINRTGIVIKYLPESDQKRFEEGIFVNGKDILNKVLENYE